jgi:ankyrin repeat protein
VTLAILILLTLLLRFVPPFSFISLYYARLSAIRAASSDQDQTLSLVLTIWPGIREMGLQVDGGPKPIHLAAQKGGERTLRLLVKHGADVNTREAGPGTGDTPLHYAVRAGRGENATFLISQGADVNAKGRNGYTPLHVAVLGYAPSQDQNSRIADREMICRLISRGASPAIPDDRGETPLVLAEEIGCSPEILRVLRSSGKR